MRHVIIHEDNYQPQGLEALAVSHSNSIGSNPETAGSESRDLV